MSGGDLPAIAQAAFLVSAVGALVLAAWLIMGRWRRGPAVGATAAALATTALWCLVVPAFGQGLLAAVLLSVTYLAWLWVLYRLFAHDGRHESLAPIRPVVFALAFVGVLQVVLQVTGFAQLGASADDMMLRLLSVFGLLFSIGALMLVHNLYAGCAPQARSALRWPATALGAIWLYDLNYHTVAYLSGDTPGVLSAARGAVPLVMVILLGLGTLQKEGDQPFRPSRSFAFQSFSLLVIGSYFVVMVLAYQGLSYLGGDFARFSQLAFFVVTSAAALVFLPSRKLRGWLRVTLAKHLFQHRYDYREEWLRFTRTMGRAGPGAPPLRERVVQALADITDSPSALLLTPLDDGGLALEAAWRWSDIEVPSPALSEASVRFFAKSQFIMDLDDWRNGRCTEVPRDVVASWLADDARAWALIPLLHYERLLGIVVLARPSQVRTLDWEDFDLLRVVGQQLASYLAEQASQDALGESQRFDEFNRRIAFVMHDIKNLASQLSLLARNAEKHADNPDFRADMLVTLRNSADKLNALLARLGRYGTQAGEQRAPLDLGELTASLSRRFAAAQHDVVDLGGEGVAMVHREALEQALVHLVQNAIDASPDGTPVLLQVGRQGTEVHLEIADSGCGMSAEFVRSHLFKPFHSSKPGGFGIGAFEAREMIRAMGGRLDVESREGLGTRFLVRLPLAEAAGVFDPATTSEITKVA